jgi:methyl-accepting chemotaxis protein
MRHRITRAMNIGMLAAVVAVGAGCATSSSMDEVRGMAQEAKNAAQAAQQSADEAQSTANSAQQTADAAKSAANTASQTAQGAQSCCNANTERLDRMFQRSQLK